MKITTAAVAFGAVAIIGLAGCSSSSDDSDASASPTASASFDQSAAMTVNAGEFGKQWPFTVDEGTIHCKGKAAWFRHGGKNYPLNDVANSEASSGAAKVENPQSSLDPILTTPGPKDPLTGEKAATADPYPIVQQGENMCGAA